tara:strand:- start:6289 stop:6930 length:642 start_codon:yes stop_codon:yes gene_type:complete
MIFEQIAIGGDRNFAYLVGDEETKKAVLVDPAYQMDELLQKVSNYGLELDYIFCTHSHADHISGNHYIKEKTKVKVLMFQTTTVECDVKVNDGDILKLGSLNFKFIFTPGHSSDDMSILVNDQKLIVGDTLFVGMIGGSDFGEGARQQFNSLKKLMMLNDNIEVYPGHGYGVKPSSTIGEEKKNNPFILKTDFNDFLWLKQHWEEYKQEKGIE